MKGTLTSSDYHKIEQKFGVKFPQSFIDWHKKFFFSDGDCSLVRLPHSLPTVVLQEVVENLDYDTAKDLIKLKLYPFAMQGNDTGPLVFDGRVTDANKEFAIRNYDLEYYGEIEGLGEIIFSSFPKLLECLAYYFSETQTRFPSEVIPEFFRIDPDGAGKTGVDYWLGWASMMRENEEYLGES